MSQLIWMIFWKTGLAGIGLMLAVTLRPQRKAVGALLMALRLVYLLPVLLLPIYAYILGRAGIGTRECLLGWTGLPVGMIVGAGISRFVLNRHVQGFDPRD